MAISYALLYWHLNRPYDVNREVRHSTHIEVRRSLRVQAASCVPAFVSVHPLDLCTTRHLGSLRGDRTLALNGS